VRLPRALLPLVLNAAVLATAAFAHPHAPGDPFADAGDTLAPGSARLAPLRAAHQRWRSFDVRGGGRVPAGTIDERVVRENSAAGGRWCVAIEERDVAGALVARDSIWLSAGSPIPIYETRAERGHVVELRFEGREVDGTWVEGGDRTSIGGESARAAFPRGAERLLIARLRLAPGQAVAVPTYAIGEGAGEVESVLAVQSAGETLLDHHHRARRCVMLAVSASDPDAGTRTVWIDRATRAVLREEIRNRSGDLLQVLEAE